LFYQITSFPTLFLILRIYFLFNRKLLKELSRISWEVIREYYINTCIKDGGKPAAVAVIQTFGDYLSFNPHMHILAADGCFGGDGFFYVPSIDIDTESIEKLFIHRIFKMLLAKGLIAERVIELISSWATQALWGLLRKKDKPKRCKVYREPGKIHHKGIVFTIGTDEILSR